MADTQPGSSFKRTTDDAGGFSAGCVVRQDLALAAVSSAEAEALAYRGAAGPTALTALKYAAGVVGLDTLDTVAAGACANNVVIWKP